MVAQLGSFCVLCGVVAEWRQKKPILSCGDRTVVRTVFVSGIEEPLLTDRPGSKSLGTKMSNNSFFFRPPRDPDNNLLFFRDGS
jgi:hypothetical protein